MGTKSMKRPAHARTRTTRCLALAVLLACGRTPALSQTTSPPPPQPVSPSLEKLVAPIALYPDPLVAQILPASTYPVQVVEAARAVANGQRPSQETASQWDPSIQALLSFPTVLKMMNDKIDWTTQLGQAVSANQANVMAAVQAVRRQAHQAGNLKSNDKQAVQVEGSGSMSTIIIEPANPQIIYVPQYNPIAILAPAPYYGYAWGPPAYGLMTFGVGFAAGAATAYACHWGYGYGYGSVTVNNSYHYNVTNNYAAYHPSSTYNRYNSSTGSYERYDPHTGTYSGYDAKTGTYGAYNPATGKYGSYNPSTGAYNKDGSTGTWHPPSSSDVGRATDDYRAGQYGSESHGTTGTLGSGYGSHGTQSYGSHSYGGGSYGAGSYGDHGYSGASRGSWGSHSDGFGSSGFGGSAFRGADGGGWGSREASDRGSGSFGRGGWGGGGGFGGGDRGFGGGGGFGGGRGFGGGGGWGGGGFGGFRGRR